MEKKIKFEKQIQPVIKKMELGDVKYYPIERLNSVQATCSNLGAALSRHFKMQRFPTLGYIQVTRTV